MSMFINLSEEFKKAREEKKLSINQLSVKTKIDIKFLEAMEAGDFAFLPELYVKAFVREYARAVGIDENKAIKKYDAAKQGLYFDETENPVEDPKPEVPKPKEVKKETAPVPPSIINPVQSYDATALTNVRDDSAAGSKRKNMILIGSFSGAVILLLIIYFVFFNSDSEIIVPEKPIEEVVEQSRQRYEEEPATSGESTGSLSSDSLFLTINASDTSWVKIIFDDKREDEFILFPNSKKSIKTLNNFKITFGKSGAISLALNNRALNYTGRGNSVLHVQIDSAGVTYLSSIPRINP